MTITIPGHDFQALAAKAYELQSKKKLGYFSLSIVFFTPENRKINLVEKGRKAESVLCGWLYDKTSQISRYEVRRESGDHRIEVTLS